MTTTMKILSAKDVIAITGASRTTLWRWERLGNFPSRVQVGPNKIGWIETEVKAWVDSRPRGFHGQLG